MSQGRIAIRPYRTGVNVAGNCASLRHGRGLTARAAALAGRWSAPSLARLGLGGWSMGSGRVAGAYFHTAYRAGVNVAGSCAPLRHGRGLTARAAALAGRCSAPSLARLGLEGWSMGSGRVAGAYCHTALSHGGECRRKLCVAPAWSGSDGPRRCAGGALERAIPGAPRIGGLSQWGAGACLAAW